MKQFVFSVAMAAMLLGGTTFAMATGSGGGGSDHGGGGSDHGGGGGGSGGGGGGSGGGGGGSGGGTSDNGDSPGADSDAGMGGSNIAAECGRVVDERRIGQQGPVSGVIVNQADRDCDMPMSGETK